MTAQRGETAPRLTLRPGDRVTAGCCTGTWEVIDRGYLVGWWWLVPTDDAATACEQHRAAMVQGCLEADERRITRADETGGLW